MSMDGMPFFLIPHVASILLLSALFLCALVLNPTWPQFCSRTMLSTATAGRSFVPIFLVEHRFRSETGGATCSALVEKIRPNVCLSLVSPSGVQVVRNYPRGRERWCTGLG